MLLADENERARRTCVARRRRIGGDAAARPTDGHERRGLRRMPLRRRGHGGRRGEARLLSVRRRERGERARHVTQGRVDGDRDGDVRERRRANHRDADAGESIRLPRAHASGGGHAGALSRSVGRRRLEPRTPFPSPARIDRRRARERRASAGERGIRRTPPPRTRERLRAQCGGCAWASSRAEISGRCRPSPYGEGFIWACTGELPTAGAIFASGSRGRDSFPRPKVRPVFRRTRSMEAI